MTKAVYKPIDETDSYTLVTGALSPVPIALYERLASNGQYLLRNRLRKSNMFWTGATTSNVTDPATVKPDDLIGTYNSALSYTTQDVAVPGNDPQTYGLQFSTHIAEPYLLTVPMDSLFGTDEGGFPNPIEGFKVRLCLRIEEADMDVLAWIRRRDKSSTEDEDVIRYGGNGNPINLINSAFPSRFEGDGYKTALELNTAGEGTALVNMTKTSVTGTDGCSYYELDIPSIHTLEGDYLSDPVNYNTKDFSNPASRFVLSEYNLVLSFLSKAGDLMQTAKIKSFIDRDITPSIFLGSGAYVELNQTFATVSGKFAIDVPPGKFHAMAKIFYNTSAAGMPPGVDYTWHHVLQMIPIENTTPNINNLFNPNTIDNPWSSSYNAGLVLYPSIPYMPTTLNPTLTAGAATGSTIELYYLSKATLFSVTAEPTLEVVP